MDTPTPQEIAEAVDCTQAYARMMLAGSRSISLKHALAVFDATGKQFGPLTGLTKREIEVARKVAA